jgi:hypothetical protein
LGNLLVYVINVVVLAGELGTKGRTNGVIVSAVVLQKGYLQEGDWDSRLHRLLVAMSSPRVRGAKQILQTPSTLYIKSKQHTQTN